MASYGNDDLPEYEGETSLGVSVLDSKSGAAKADTHVGTHASGFRDMLLRPELSRAIADAGFEAPSEVQHECIPKAIMGTDILCQAKSGMGKTAVFVLSILQQIDLNAQGVQALVLCHVRELAYQICEDFDRFKTYMPSVSTAVFFGGVPVKQQADLLKEKQPSIVIGTPGRVMDLLQQKALKLDTLKFFVLDECDRMLSDLPMRKQVQDIFKALPRKKQVMMFSATMPAEIMEVAKYFMVNPWVVLVNNQQNLTLHGLVQYYAKLEEKDKNEKLMQLLDELEFNQVVIFVSSVARAPVLAKLLNELKFPAVAIHGGRRVDQEERLKKFTEFRDFKHRIIVTTDMFARGIDVERVNIVINYDMPADDDTYLHRVGRAGRFGTKGLAISFVASEKDEEVLKKVQSRFAAQIEPLPEGKIDRASYMAV